MASAPISSASSFSPSPITTVARLAQQHRRLRTWVRGLLGLGAVLLLALMYYALNRPSRAMLSGYRFQQVGVRADKSRWILAYRNGKAEVLFQSVDTSKGWQRHALGLEPFDAWALALDWGGKALLVGGNGKVRVYNSSLQLPDSLKDFFLLPARSPKAIPHGRNTTLTVRNSGIGPSVLLTDSKGTHAIIVGDGLVYSTNDGGRNWSRRYWQEDAFLTDTISTGIAVQTKTAVRFIIVSRRGYYMVDADSNAIGSARQPWATPLPAAAVWCGIQADGSPWAIDRRGNWASRYTSGTDTGAQEFFSKIRSIAQLDSTGNFLGISPKRFFHYKMAGFQAVQKRQPTTETTKKLTVNKTNPAKAKTPTASRKATRRPTSSAKAASKNPATKTTPPEKEPDSKQVPPAVNSPQQQTNPAVQQSNPAVQQTRPASDNQIPKPGKEKSSVQQ